MESPFDTTHKIIAEPSLYSDLLRIVAKEVPGLSPSDRSTMREAAETLDELRREVLLLQAKLSEAQSHLGAQGDQIDHLRRSRAFPTLSATFVGPFQMGAR